MKTLKVLSVATLLATVFSCSNNASEEAANEMDSVATEEAVMLAEPPPAANQSPERKFVRTAQLKFKVKNVAESTRHIESVTNRYGGFLELSDLQSSLDRTTVVAVSSDSSLETNYFNVSNTINFRVPSQYLDTVLQLIVKDAEYLDYRTVEAEDVALQLLENKLAQQRAKKSGERLETAIQKNNKKLGETTDAAESVEEKERNADAAKITNLTLHDRVNYSSVSVRLYQKQGIKRELIANDKNIDEYEPGFGTKLLESLKTGWKILESVVVFLLKLWGVILLVVSVYLIYRFWSRREYKK